MKRLVTILALIGAAISAVCIACVAAWLWRSGWVDRLTPPPPVVRETVVAAPVALELEGPSTCIRGETYVFLARASGSVGRPQWKVIPEVTGAIEPIGNDGLAVRFRSLDEGVFSIIVSVAGDGNQIANAHREFENVDLVEEAVAEETVAATPRTDPEQAVVMEEPLPPTVAELALGALLNVNSGDRPAEARIVAGTIRSVIGRIDTGLVPPETDCVTEIEKQSRSALGGRAEGWTMFFAAMHTIVDSLRQQGEVTTAASTVPTLAEIAGALQQSR